MSPHSTTRQNPKHTPPHPKHPSQTPSDLHINLINTPTDPPRTPPSHHSSLPDTQNGYLENKRFPPKLAQSNSLCPCIWISTNLE